MLYLHIYRKNADFFPLKMEIVGDVGDMMNDYLAGKKRHGRYYQCCSSQ